MYGPHRLGPMCMALTCLIIEIKIYQRDRMRRMVQMRPAKEVVMYCTVAFNELHITAGDYRPTLLVIQINFKLVFSSCVYRQDLICFCI